MTTGSAPRAGRHPVGRHHVVFAAAASVVAALDQLTKHWALGALDDGPIDLVGSLRLKLVFNDGAAFSLGGGRTTLVAVLALAVSALVLWLGITSDQRGRALGFGVVFGGAIGNLIDRALRAGDGVLGGHVVDFVDLQWWPVFNVADIALWIGIAILVVASRNPSESS